MDTMEVEPERGGQLPVATQHVNEITCRHALISKHYEESVQAQSLMAAARGLAQPPGMAKGNKGKQPKSSELRELVARRLTAARKAYEPNASQMARDLEISPQRLHSYESNRNYPDEHFLVRFCNLTGCTFDWLFRGKMEAKLPAAMAVRIALSDPDLVSDRRALKEMDGTEDERASAERAEAEP